MVYEQEAVEAQGEVEMSHEQDVEVQEATENIAVDEIQKSEAHEEAEAELASSFVQEEVEVFEPSEIVLVELVEEPEPSVYSAH